MKRFFKVLLVIFLGLFISSCELLEQFLPSSSSSSLISSISSSSSNSTYEYTISFEKDSLEIDVNESIYLNVIFSKEVENKTITFESSDNKIASVDQNGLVKGISAGVCRIIATSSNNSKASCLITVYNVIEKVSINEIDKRIYVGDIVELSATITPSDVKDSTLNWSIDETDCATLKNNILTTTKPGIINISVTTVNNIKDTYEIQIYTHVEISFDYNETLTLNTNESKQINVSISPENINYGSINWYSENDEIATVENGVITGVNKGKTNVYASIYYEDVEIKKSIEIIVVLPDILNVNFADYSDSDFTSNGVSFDASNGYYKFTSVGNKLTSPKINTNLKTITIEITYKATKSGENNEDFNFKISANKDTTSLSEINLNSSNTSFSSGSNLNTFKDEFPIWNSDEFANNITFELTQKKTGSNFWLYGIRLYYTDSEVEVLTHDNISFHFLELGNKYTGDSIYIKAGEIDILIDAGSTKGSASTITEYLNNYVKDGKLEYVIATHAHEDHIAGFVGSSSAPGIFKAFEVGTIIDYALKNTTSNISKEYESLRDELVSNGTIHYTAADCINKTNGGTDYYEIADGISFTILNQIHYFEKSSDENDYSVCTLFTVGESNFLFTGDLEAGGEASLVELNNLPHCVLYKAGHHGSKTSSNNELLKAITPEIVTVCCCAGSSEYTKDTDNMFPTQDFITRIAPYTTKVYVTTQATYTIETSDGKEYLKYNGFESMNGNIIISYTNNEISIQCSNNNTKLKDSEWFNRRITLNGTTRSMRIWPNVESMYN
ncbi:MAG: Ig-like domain-containing protein [Bacilli bacterium]|nr:Ig-like domain-containing protein [Bacilli bacterium]